MCIVTSALSLEKGLFVLESEGKKEFKQGVFKNNLLNQHIWNNVSLNIHSLYFLTYRHMIKENSEAMDIPST